MSRRARLHKPTEAHLSTEACRGRTVHLRFAPGHEALPTGPQWHEPPLLLRRPGGVVEVVGQAGSLDGALRYALSFGAAVEVIGPPALRRRVAEEIRRMAARYDSPEGFLRRKSEER